MTALLWFGTCLLTLCDFFLPLLQLLQNRWTSIFFDLLDGRLFDFRFCKRCGKARCKLIHRIDNTFSQSGKLIECVFQGTLRCFSFWPPQPVQIQINLRCTFPQSIFCRFFRNNSNGFVVGNSRNFFQQHFCVINLLGKFIQSVFLLLDLLIIAHNRQRLICRVANLQKIFISMFLFQIFKLSGLLLHSFFLLSNLFFLLCHDIVLLFQISPSTVFRHFIQFKAVAFGYLEQHRAAGRIERDFAIVIAAKGLIWLRQFKAKCFQCLFLLGCNFTIFVLTVKHMTFVDVRGSLIQMQSPIQNVNVLAETLMELIHKFCGDLKKFFWGSVALQRSKLIDAFFWAGFLAGKQIFGGTVSLRVPDFGVALILFFGEVGVMQFVVELFNFFKGICQTILIFGLQGRTDAVITIPIDVLLDTLWVDMLAVGDFKTAVIVLRVISAVLSGSAIVSGQFQRPSLLSGGTQRTPCAG